MFGLEEAQVNEAAEENLLELQNNIQSVERKLRITETEKNVNSLENNSNVKKNELETKRLKMEVQELQVRLERRQKANENMMAKEFQKHFRDFSKFQGKSAKEVRRLLDAEAIELQRRSKDLQHELELRARTLHHSKGQHGEMVTDCDDYFESEPTEYHSLQHIRELENEHQKISKYITESEIAENALELMKNQLEKGNLSNALLSQAVQKDHEQLLQQETDVTGIEELKKEVRFLKDENLKPSEQESELLMMKAGFERIKETTGVTDIQEADNRFLEQKDLEDRLSEVKKTFAKTLHDLKVEKKQLDSKMELLQGSGERCRERDMGDELCLTRTRLKEQERRKERTTLDLEKSIALLAALELRAHKLMQSVGREMPQLHKQINPNMTVSELMAKLEEILKKSENFLSLGSCEEMPSDNPNRKLNKYT